MARKGNILCQKSKNKKAKAPKDFLKDKIQVGKKKKPASNDTKTDYKVAQIQMPAQSALSEKGEEVTQRGLTLQDLLAHVGHHSAKVREDAFRGLHELCSAHEGLLSTSLARILDAEAMIAIDASAAVREAFRKFQAWLIEALPLGSFEAFASTLAIQVRSALSHVSSEIRDDGLLLLELYVSRRSGMQVLNQAESFRIVQTLCQQKTQPDLVLRCLHRLLLRAPEQEPLQNPTSQNMLGTPRAASWDLEHRVSKCPRLSLQSALSARALGNSSDGNTDGPDNMTPSSGDSPADSPIWEFCLRTWLQAGELPRVASGRGAAAAGGPGWIQMRCAAVMEHALEAAALQATDITYAQSVMALRPSAAQLSTLVGVVRRGEWPLQVDSANSFRALADSVNLRMARVLALLASGGAPEDTPRTQLTRLACAALNFLDGFSSRASSSLEHSKAISGAGFDPCADVEVMEGASAVAFALGSLDLLWATLKETVGVQVVDAVNPGRGPALGPEHSVQLVTITARFASGGSDEGGEMSTASAILAAPLAAALLGLRLSSSALNTPSSVRSAWPRALVSCGASFAEVVEHSCPGAALTWVSVWPKLLWYLGDSDPVLSAFLLSLVLDLAKLASRAGGLHEKLLGKACSLLLPFLVGRPGSKEEAPPLALLPRGLAGAQGLAAAVLPHFPKISDALVAALTRLICQWSDLGFSGEHLMKKAAGKKQKVIGLGDDCCELILETLLTSGGKAEPRSLPTRMRVAFTVLCAHPPSAAATADAVAQSETAALRLADALAGWLMSLHIHEQSAFPAMPALSYDDRRRLALQSLAWPLCKEGLPVAPSLAPRLLCFLFFCAARIPNIDTDVNGAQADKAADLGWRDFLCLLFDSFLGVDLISPGGAKMAVCTSPLCDPERGKVRGPAETQSHRHLLSKGLENDSNNLRWVSLRRLAHLFVMVWMKAVPAPQKPAAYELLIKLCAGKLARLPDIAADSQQSAWQIMSVLIAAIAHRNEVTLPTSSWGSEGSPSAPSLKTLGPGALRSDIAMQLQRLSIVAEKRDEVKAMLPLL